MLRRTPPLQMSAGMRRILKNKGRVIDYIRQSVKAGTYRTSEELEQVMKERNDSEDDLRVVMRRFRQDIIRGSQVHDYPIEYRILEQHPPIPDPPVIPKKYLRTMPKEPNPVEPLVEKYYRRQQRVEEEESTQLSVEEYYRRLLGVPAPSLAGSSGSPTSLALKPASLQKAYAAAITHYKLQRTQNMSDEEAVQAVDELLKEQEKTEIQVSGQRAQAVAKTSARMLGKQFAPKTKPNTTDEDFEQTKALGFDKTLDSIFEDNPRLIEGMMRWSDRLQAVPYREWTVGSSTALDHWIARCILGLSEETWWSVVEGEEYAAVGRDIVAVREALFPETGGSLVAQQEDEENDEIEEEEISTSGKTVEELLASLGALKVTDDAAKTSVPQEQEPVPHDLDQVVDQLQVWRQKQLKSPYAQWSSEEQTSFDSWLRNEYVAHVMPGSQGEIDFTATREALLSDPPIDSRAESDAFWDALQDERTARVWLEEHSEERLPAAAAPWIPAGFWKLAESEQLERILNLGALRPLLDEYATPSGRAAFLQEHLATLLTGVPLEHFVRDDLGPIEASEIGKKEGRFCMEKQAFGENANVVLQAWNQQKAGRAKYEERLFQTGRLGLRYSDKLPSENEISDDNEGDKRNQ
jgi:hypothetical protein